MMQNPNQEPASRSSARELIEAPVANKQHLLVLGPLPVHGAYFTHRKITLFLIMSVQVRQVFFQQRNSTVGNSTNCEALIFGM